MHQDDASVRTGFVVPGGDFDFSIQDQAPQIRANNTGPLKQFLRRIGEDKAGAALERPPLLIGANECDARFIRNTQALIAAIYGAVDKTT